MTSMAVRDMRLHWPKAEKALAEGEEISSPAIPSGGSAACAGASRMHAPPSRSYACVHGDNMFHTGPSPARFAGGLSTSWARRMALRAGRGVADDGALPRGRGYVAAARRRDGGCGGRLPDRKPSDHIAYSNFRNSSIVRAPVPLTSAWAFRASSRGCARETTTCEIVRGANEYLVAPALPSSTKPELRRTRLQVRSGCSLVRRGLIHRATMGTGDAVEHVLAIIRKRSPRCWSRFQVEADASGHSPLPLRRCLPSKSRQPSRAGHFTVYPPLFGRE